MSKTSKPIFRCISCKAEHKAKANLPHVVHCQEIADNGWRLLDGMGSEAAPRFGYHLHCPKCVAIAFEALEAAA